MTGNRLKSQKGNVLIEFALGWSVLWLMFAGLFQFGYAFYNYNVLMTAVTNAAELGSKLDYDTGSPAAFTNAIKNMVVYGDETAGAKALIPNLSTGNVTVDAGLDANSIPQNITVSVTYSINTVFSTITLTNKPRVTMRFMGKVVCASC